MPVIAATVLLDLANMKDLVLFMSNGYNEKDEFILTYEVGLADLIGHGIEPDSNGAWQGDEGQEQWQGVVCHTLIGGPWHCEDGENRSNDTVGYAIRM